MLLEGYKPQLRTQCVRNLPQTVIVRKEVAEQRHDVATTLTALAVIP